MTQPYCQPDCFLVGCAGLNCGPNDIIGTKPGECCQSCIPQRNCTDIACDVIECFENEISIVPDGECCPICVPGLCNAQSAIKEISTMLHIASYDNNIIIIICISIISLILLGICIGLFIRKCCLSCNIINSSTNKGYHTINKQNITTASDITDIDNL